MKLSRTLVIALVVVVVVIAAIGTWLALSGSDEASTRGTCGNSTYELEVGDDDGTTEVSFELRTAAPGEAWSIVLNQGDTVLQEVERTADDEAEISAEAFGQDGAGDTFSVVATPAEGGDACEATVSR